MKIRKYYIFIFLLAASVNFFCSAAGSLLSNKSIPVGGKAEFSLDSDNKGGFEWQLGQNSDPKVLDLISKNFVESLDGKGKDVFLFKGKKKGTVEIVLNYVNKNLTGNKIVKTKKYSVTVR